jgi:hypothetical protein
MRRKLTRGSGGWKKVLGLKRLNGKHFKEVAEKYAKQQLVSLEASDGDDADISISSFVMLSKRGLRQTLGRLFSLHGVEELYRTEVDREDEHFLLKRKRH